MNTKIVRALGVASALLLIGCSGVSSSSDSAGTQSAVSAQPGARCATDDCSDDGTQVLSCVDNNVFVLTQTCDTGSHCHLFGTPGVPSCVPDSTDPTSQPQDSCSVTLDSGGTSVIPLNHCGVGHDGNAAFCSDPSQPPQSVRPWDCPDPTDTCGADQDVVVGQCEYSIVDDPTAGPVTVVTLCSANTDGNTLIPVHLGNCPNAPAQCNLEDGSVVDSDEYDCYFTYGTNAWLCMNGQVQQVDAASCPNAAN
jgi:hypothetical protein